MTITQDTLKTLLEANGFFVAIRRVLDKLMHAARQQGVFREDVEHVLMVGGMSLMPLVQDAVKTYFSDSTVYSDKPFTAVAEGALVLAEGGGLDDFLGHSYGLRYLDGDQHRFDEILPMGTQIPLKKPIEVMLQAAHVSQTELEIVIGEIDPERAAMVEVVHNDGDTVFVASGAVDDRISIHPLNADTPLVVQLQPPGTINTDRVLAAFTIDEQRQLRVTITDRQRRKVLLRDAVVLTLR